MTFKNIGYPYKRTYSGLFNPTTDILQNAKNKLLNLLYTKKGQRIIANNCEFGLNLQRILFENLPYEDADNLIKNQLQRQINRWIPQIKTLNIDVKFKQQTIIINIKFSVDYEQFETIMLEIMNNG